MTPAVVIATLVAGALGALARYALSRALAPRGPFPWAVLIVNVAGSGIGGAVLALAELGNVSADLRLVLVAGLCGGLTTFSTWTVESVQLVTEDKPIDALLNVLGNLVLGIAAAAGAFALVFAAVGR